MNTPHAAASNPAHVNAASMTLYIYRRRCSCVCLPQVCHERTAALYDQLATLPTAGPEAVQQATYEYGFRQLRSTPGLWQQWQLAVLHAFRPLHGTLAALGLPTAAAAAAAASEVAAATSLQDLNSSSTTSSTTINPATTNLSASASSSNSSNRSLKWSCLPSVLAGSSSSSSSMAAFNSKWPDLQAAVDAASRPPSAPHTVRNGGSSSSSSNTAEHGSGEAQQQQVDVCQLYAGARELCRPEVAAVPLPLVCNNPSCNNLTSASEADAAKKLCAGCRCRYSPACQTADWKRHRRACKRMAAAEQACR
jgi:hypothetical protein